jgi:hypothetical protein
MIERGERLLLYFGGVHSTTTTTMQKEPNVYLKKFLLFYQYQ